MGIRYGSADSPEAYGFALTVEAPNGTTPTAPVEVGSIWKLSGNDADGGGYKIAAAVDNDTTMSVVLVQALERAVGVNPMSVRVLGGFGKVVRLPYLHGAAPTIGQSVQVSATVTKVDGKAYDSTSYVLYVDTAAEEVEVLC